MPMKQKPTCKTLTPNQYSKLLPVICEWRFGFGDMRETHTKNDSTGLVFSLIMIHLFTDLPGNKLENDCCPIK